MCLYDVSVEECDLVLAFLLLLRSLISQHKAALRTESPLALFFGTAFR